MKRKPYKFIINIKKRQLKYKNYLNYTEKQGITPTIIRFILFMSDNKYKSTYEIGLYMKYVYIEQVYRLINYTKERIPTIEITNRKGIGYRLKNKIYIDY